jgi:hypothetical protein
MKLRQRKLAPPLLPTTVAHAEDDPLGSSASLSFNQLDSIQRPRRKRTRKKQTACSQVASYCPRFKQYILCLSVILLALVGLARTLLPLWFIDQQTRLDSGWQAQSRSTSILHRVHQHVGLLQKWQRLKHESASPHGTLVYCDDSQTTQGYLNDNYCDCYNGRDENETSACSNLLVHQAVFSCRDGSKAIYTSRVRDGIRDCPDGSDEE